jgi:hypothetical protein
LTLEVLYGTLMLLRGLQAVKAAEIPTLSCLGIFFARIKAVFAGCEFSDHDALLVIQNEDAPVTNTITPLIGMN